MCDFFVSHTGADWTGTHSMPESTMSWQELMQQLLELETRPLGLQHGKAAAAAVAGFASKLEFRRVSEAQVQPLVHFLLGTLHMRYCSLPCCCCRPSSSP